MADYLENAAKCRELAAASTNESSRDYWQRMEAFWLKRAAEPKESPSNSTDVVKIVKI
jgi:hypothetical protein